MSVPGWHSGWYRKGESVLSVALKLAHGNFGVAADALRGLVRAKPSHRLPTMFPSAETASRACALLGLPREAATSLFAGVGVPVAAQRDRLGNALRWCPTCMSQRYHSWLFQDWQRTHCVWHADALLNRCPRCGLIVDPFLMSGWTCPNCRQPFAEPLGLDWVRVLCRPVDAEICPEDEVDRRLGLSVDRREDLISVTLRHRQTNSTVDRAALKWHEAAWLRCQAWEQCSAIVDSLFADHRDCVANEWIAGRTEFAITSFACPLGAGVRQVLAWLGCQHERVEGWPSSKMSMNDDFGAYARAMEAAPSWLVPVLGREVIKDWLGNAIEQFSGAARLPHGQLAWRPRQEPLISWRIDGNSAVVFTMHQEAKLRDQIAAGGRACLAATAVGLPFNLSREAITASKW
jgi:hypothetical protein